MKKLLLIIATLIITTQLHSQTLHMLSKKERFGCDEKQVRRKLEMLIDMTNDKLDGKAVYDAKTIKLIRKNEENCEYIYSYLGFAIIDGHKHPHTRKIRIFFKDDGIDDFEEVRENELTKKERFGCDEKRARSIIEGAIKQTNNHEIYFDIRSITLINKDDDNCEFIYSYTGTINRNGRKIPHKEIVRIYLKDDGTTGMEFFE